MLSAMNTISLTGRDLTLADVGRVARDGVNATLDPAARERVAASRRTVEELVRAGQPVYGVTTG
jgi:Histidine ammonia-lyase